MHDTFTRAPHANPEVDEKPGAAARRMILRIVNSLSAKMEIGAPMAALYLLGNPDHYTSHEFRIFYWKNFVNFVETEWDRYVKVMDPQELPSGANDVINLAQDVGIVRSEKENEEIKAQAVSEDADTLLVQRSKQSYVGKTATDDYRYRPSEHSALCLYEWVQCSVKMTDITTRAPRQDLLFYPYLPEHPLHNSHVVACDLDRREFVVPNFVGPALPKRDGSNREEYCRTMLVLFCPWRTGTDLKAVDESWEEVFDKYQFTPRQLDLMVNFNLRYECYDARDDYGAQIKAASNQRLGPDEDDDDGEYVDPEFYEDLIDDDQDFIMIEGTSSKQMLQVNEVARASLKDAGWQVSQKRQEVSDFVLPRVVVDKNFNGTAWKSIIKSEKNKIWQTKFKAAELQSLERNPRGEVRYDAYVVPGSYMTRDFVPARREWSDILNRIAKDFSLNREQKKAFDIVANHATCVAPEQLLMHLGGMGGTGKSQNVKRVGGCSYGVG
ncbi:hypothetical protein MD484_g3159, partial [Candolleomyces efflorescens]